MIGWKELFDLDNDNELRDAIKLIEKFDRVYEDFIKGTDSLIKRLVKSQTSLVKSLDGVSKEVNSFNSSTEKGRESISKMNKVVDLSTKQYTENKNQIKKLSSEVTRLQKEKTSLSQKSKDLNNIDKEAIRLESQLAKATSRNSKEHAELKIQIQEANKRKKELAKESLGLISIYQKESARLNDLRNKFKDVALSQGENSKEAKRLQKEMSTLDVRLKKVDASAGQFQRNVGNYPSAFKGAIAGARQLATALGFTGVLFALVGAFRNAFKTIKDFQKQNAVLAGVLNKTRSEITELTNDATRLGGTTAKTASEVTDLQIAYARLGFSQQEIINLTEDTINGSIALNAALDETAELTGAVIRTFDDLTTVDADVVLDQMTVATQKSALNFEKLQTTIPIVAGAANAAGVPFTRLLSLLGKLSDAGIDASSSATSLRNIFIESSAQGLNYNQILDKISNSQDQLTAANDEFGKRAAVSGTILSNLSSEVGKLDTQLQNAGGTAKRVADEQLNTLDGQVKLLTSAWQGFILSIESGDGSIAKFSRGFFKMVTESLVALTNFDLVLSTMFKDIERISDMDVIRLIDAGMVTESGKKVSEFFKILDETPFDKIIDNSDKYKKQVVDAFIAEGESLEESKRLFKAWYNEKEKGYKTARTAQQLFDVAQKKGLKTFEDFEKQDIKFTYTDAANKLEILSAVQGKYNNESEKTVEVEKELIVTNKKVNQSFHEVASKGVKTLGDEISVTLPEKMDRYEEKAQSTASKLSQWYEVAGEKIMLALNTAFDVASIAVNQFFENQSIKRENAFKEFEDQRNIEIQQLEDKRDRELENENLTAEAKKNINQRYEKSIGVIEDRIEKKRLETQRKAAKSQKAQAIFNVALSTSQAIISALAQVPKFDFGISAAAIAASYGIIGAAQIAAIAAQPIPAYAEGTKDHPGGLAFVGDGGKRELILEPSGRVYLSDDKPQLVDMPRGSEVLNGAITENILRNKDVNDKSAQSIQRALSKEKSGINAEMKNFFKSENDNVIEGFKKAMNGIEIHQWKMGSRGIKRDVRRGNTIEKDVKEENAW